MDAIGRLRIVCVADRRRSTAALAVRSRLERVARSELGRALDAQVAVDSPVSLGRLTVRLDMDPDAYDDRTLAILWADRIREAIVAATSLASAATGRTSAVDVPSPDDRGNERTRGLDERLLPLARRAILGDAAAATAIARAILADPAGVGRALRTALSAPERRALFRLLEGRGAGGRGRRLRLFPGPPVSGRLRSVRRSEPRTATRLPARMSWTAGLAIASRRWLAGRSREAAIELIPPPTEVPARPKRARRGVAMPADRQLGSQVAGLGLLWPWLTAQLEAACDRLRRLDPAEARRLALAALVPGMAAAVDDPVIRLLAGDDPATDPSHIVVTEGDLLLAAEGAAKVLEAFAAALPGFAGSTQDFIRREFLVRAGVVNPAADPVTVTAAPLPLDPALSQLRYPIGAFRLPWTRPITLRLERA
jgi:Contractile injection system tape measure protein